MEKIKKIPGILDKINALRKSNNNSKNSRFIPRQTFSVNINGVEYYISLICCDNNFDVKVVLLDSNNSIVSTILELDTEGAYIVKLKNKLYVITDNHLSKGNKVYIYDITNLKANPKIEYLCKENLTAACANKNSIYAYSSNRDKIIKYNEDMIPIQEYNNRYSKDNIWIPVELACNEETFFSIPSKPSTAEQFEWVERFMEYYVSADLKDPNEMIHSCSFNNDDNTLYISMSNIIWIVKNGTEFSYIKLKDRTMTKTFYDNDIKKLILNLGGTKGKHVFGEIRRLSDKEIQEKAIRLADFSSSSKYSNNANAAYLTQKANSETTGNGIQTKGMEIDER